jgi:hypothetical protein
MLLDPWSCSGAWANLGRLIRALIYMSSLGRGMYLFPDKLLLLGNLLNVVPHCAHSIVLLRLSPPYSTGLTSCTLS